MLVISGPTFTTFADSSTTASLDITAGSLSESAQTTVTATGVTLNGSDTTTTYTLPLTVDDDTGSDAGWNLSITSTQFSDGSGHTLSDTASTINTLPTEACASGSTCTAPTNTVSYGTALTVPAGTTAPAAVPLYDAAASTGEGNIVITPIVTIAIPGNTHTATYTSTVSVTIASGP